MGKKLAEAMNSLKIGETLDVKITCVESYDCSGCIFYDEHCYDMNCQRNNITVKFIFEL